MLRLVTVERGICPKAQKSPLMTPAERHFAFAETNLAPSTIRLYKGTFKVFLLRG